LYGLSVRQTGALIVLFKDNQPTTFPPSLFCQKKTDSILRQFHFNMLLCLFLFIIRRQRWVCNNAAFSRIDDSGCRIVREIGVCNFRTVYRRNTFETLIGWNGFFKVVPGDRDNS